MHASVYENINITPFGPVAITLHSAILAFIRSFSFLCLCLYLCMCLCLCLRSLCLSVCLFFCLSVCMSLSLSLSLSLSVCLSVCLSVSLFLFHFVSVSLWLSLSLGLFRSLCLSLSFSVSLALMFLCICYLSLLFILSIPLSIYLSSLNSNYIFVPSFLFPHIFVFHRRHCFPSLSDLLPEPDFVLHLVSLLSPSDLTQRTWITWSQLQSHPLEMSTLKSPITSRTRLAIHQSAPSIWQRQLLLLS